MAFPRIITADEAAALDPGRRCRHRLLLERPRLSGRRARRHRPPLRRRPAHPRDLTTLHPIAAGDMWGIKGIDHIAKPGLLARILGGSYPSRPVVAPSRR